MKNVNTFFLKILVICLLAFFMLTFVACGIFDIKGYTLDKDEIYRNDSPIAVAFVLGNHANAMAIPDDAYHYIEKMLDNVVYGGYACAIVVDATPTKVELVGTEFFQEDARSEDNLNKAINDRKDTLINVLKELAPADTPEVDLLGAIREAKNALESVHANSIPNKQIVIIDTGISTAGDLNFVDLDLLNRDPGVEPVVNQLKSYKGRGVLPDLKGITVTFVGTSDGLAEVADPQLVSVADKKYIKELWEAIIQECGADKVQFESAAGWTTPNIYTEDVETDFPYVSVITFFHERIIDFSDLPSYDPNTPDPQPSMPPPPSLSVRLGSEVVGFAPESADYQNIDAAKRILDPYARELENYLNAYPDEKIWIVGTTAAYRNVNGSVDLSLERAEMVKETLIELGLPEDKLVTVGLGAKFPWSVDERPNGSFNTVVAQANRAVWLLNTSEECEEFCMLKSAYEDGELLPEAVERISQFIL